MKDDRLGAERWDEMPRSNKWSFEQNLWWLTKRAQKGIAPVPVIGSIDQVPEAVRFAIEGYHFEKVTRQVVAD